jgi:ACR3 family arsenite efflux pump ArsB
MKTNVGSSFMIAFNAWYYSFSPPVANQIASSWAERAVVRASLYPLIGILVFSNAIFTATGVFPELAVLISGIVASSLLGAVYLGLPLGLVRARVRRLRPGARSAALKRSISLLLLCGIAAVAVGELLDSPVMLMIASVMTVLSSITLSAGVTSSKIGSLSWHSLKTPFEKRHSKPFV